MIRKVFLISLFVLASIIFLANTDKAHAACSLQGTTCTSNPQCQASSGCENFTCVGYIQGRTPGTCQDVSSICTKAEQSCSTDSDCRVGSACSQYYCWTIGNKNKVCKKGQPPTTDTIDTTTTSEGTSLTTIEEQGLPGFNFAGAKLGDIIQKAIPWIFGLAGIGLLLYLIYGGFHLMTSGGEPKAMQEAKGKITNALIGFIIIFVAYWIVQIVGRVFGLTGITDIFQ